MKKKSINSSTIVALLMLLCTTIWAQNKNDIDKRLQVIEEVIQQKRQKKGNQLISQDLLLLSKGQKSANYESFMTYGNNIALIGRCISNVASLKKELQELGAVDIKTYKMTVSFKLSMDKISELNNCKELKRVIPELKPITRVGDVTSEAVKSLKVNQVLNTYGLTGKNVKIGVLSDSYNALGGEAAGIASGDLPGVGNPNGYSTPVNVLSEIATGSGGIDEGRAMIELIHDIAPEAEILFYSAFNGYFDFGDGIRALADAGADIIVDDISYFTEPFFQNGFIAQAVNDVVRQGVVYFSSAGNSGELSYESNYRNFKTQQLSLHDFDPTSSRDGFQTIVVPANSGTTLSFQWDQPSPLFTDGPGSTAPQLRTDMDIFVFDPDTNELLFQSTNLNEDSSVEVLNITTQSTPLVIDVAIVKSSGPNPKRIKWVNYRDDITSTEYDTKSSTVVGHANAQRAIAVGAVAFFNAQGFNGRDNSRINGFSSLGGTLLRLNDNGSRKNTPLDTRKPDFCATDGTNTTFFGSDIPNQTPGGTPLENDTNPNFFGTSAAAPHAAAVAGLLLQANPDLRPNQVKNIMKNTATDMDNPLTANFDAGYDRKTGFGYINARRAVVRTIKNIGIKNLLLTSVCSNNPDVRLRWRVRNSNPFNVTYTYNVVGTNQNGSFVAKPGDNFFNTNRVSGSNTTKITWKDQNNNNKQTVKASGFAICQNLFTSDDNDEIVEENITFYPNPVVNKNISISYFSNSIKNETINIVPINNINSAASILSMPVQLIPGKNEVIIDVSGLKPGIYALRIGNKTKKIIKQ